MKANEKMKSVIEMGKFFRIHSSFKETDLYKFYISSANSLTEKQKLYCKEEITKQ